MPKRMSDDDVMDYVYSKLFNDLDGIESHSMFDDKEGDMSGIEGTAANAEPESHGSGGMKVTIEPLMVSAKEGEKDTDEENEDDDDDLKGIGSMSPLMEQLHGKR